MLDDDEVFVDVGGVCLPPFCSDARLAGDKTDQAHQFQIGVVISNWRGNFKLAW